MNKKELTVTLGFDLHPTNREKPLSERSARMLGEGLRDARTGKTRIMSIEELGLEKKMEAKIDKKIEITITIGKKKITLTEDEFVRLKEMIASPIDDPVRIPFVQIPPYRLDTGTLTTTYGTTYTTNGDCYVITDGPVAAIN